MTTIDKLMVLAHGDVDRLRLAISRAAAGRKSADLGDVVQLLTDKRG